MPPAPTADCCRPRVNPSAAKRRWTPNPIPPQICPPARWVGSEFVKSVAPERELRPKRSAQSGRRGPAPQRAPTPIPNLTKPGPGSAATRPTISRSGSAATGPTPPAQLRETAPPEPVELTLWVLATAFDDNLSRSHTAVAALRAKRPEPPATRDGTGLALDVACVLRVSDWIGDCSGAPARGLWRQEH